MNYKNSFRYLILSALLLSFVCKTQQQETDDTVSTEEEDDDDCAFISGQSCDKNGICKFCAMCLQSSCILSKTINSNSNNVSVSTINNNNNCNATQFGTTSLYNWYDYCLSSDNDSGGNYCATSTECYQYRKSAGPSVTYAWNNLTCNPSTCTLMASNGAPPPIPLPPSSQINDAVNSTGANSHTKNHDSDISNTAGDENRHRYYHYNRVLRNPATIALIIVCCLAFVASFCWWLRLCKKMKWWPFCASTATAVNSATSPKEGRGWNPKRFLGGGRQQPSSATQANGNGSHDSISSIPSSAPPSFSSIPPDMSVLRHPHPASWYIYHPSSSSILSARSSTSNNPANSRQETLPSYLSPYLSPPKYEQAIVTQIRDLRDDVREGRDDYHTATTAPIPSMWVPVYFTQRSAASSSLHPGNVVGQGDHNSGRIFGFAPNHYFIQHQQQQEATTSRQQPQRDDNNTNP